jgi:5-methylcytosine-specific restriction endonuclease McrA
MRSLPIPTDATGHPFDAREVFRLCISHVQQPAGLKVRLQSIEQAIADAAILYDQRARASLLYAFPRADNVGGVTKNEMVKIYTYRMVDPDQPGRVVYDQIIGAAPDGMCPLCGFPGASTLDHHLPKADYPVLAVTPNNLVPSCTRCQTIKKAAYPQTAEEQTLHPYYDNIEDQVWLTAVVNQDTPASFSFEVTPPAGWDDVMIARVTHHLNTFQLFDLFAKNAANELAGIRSGLRALFAEGGVNSVRAQLLWAANTWLNNEPNSWQQAMYRASTVSDWFCNEGFNLV